MPVERYRFSAVSIVLRNRVLPVCDSRERRQFARRGCLCVSLGGCRLSRRLDRLLRWTFVLLFLNGIFPLEPVRTVPDYRMFLRRVLPAPVEMFRYEYPMLFTACPSSSSFSTIAGFPQYGSALGDGDMRADFLAVHGFLRVYRRCFWP